MGKGKRDPNTQTLDLKSVAVQGRLAHEKLSVLHKSHVLLWESVGSRRGQTIPDLLVPLTVRLEVRKVKWKRRRDLKKRLESQNLQKHVVAQIHKLNKVIE